MNDLDRLLTENDQLVPSGGFSSRVMDAVTEAAAAPAPLPFPWARFSILVLACAAWAASAAWLATTTAVGELWTALASADETTRRMQDLGVLAAITVAVAFVLARWRPDSAPTP